MPVPEAEPHVVIARIPPRKFYVLTEKQARQARHAIGSKILLRRRGTLVRRHGATSPCRDTSHLAPETSGRRRSIGPGEFGWPPP